MLILIVLIKDNTCEKRKVVTYWGFWFLRNIDLASFCPSLPFHLTSIDTSINKDRITLKMSTKGKKR